MAIQLPFFDPEEIGRRRLPDNKEYRASLTAESAAILSVMLDLIASNYPKDTNSNLAAYFRVMAREIARQQDSMNFINDDKVFTQTRIEYIQQILGERLFINDQLVPITTKDDISYRKFLIAIKDAYLKGSKKSTIEGLINTFTDLKVNIRELYLEARKPFSAVELVDTHKMVIELFIDDLIAGGKSIAEINKDLAFFVNQVKPAHVLYDTKLIWTEFIAVNKIHDLYFGDLGGGCVPKYIWTPFNEKVVLALKIQVVDPSTTGTDIYEIGSIQPEKLVIYLTNDTKVIVEPGTDGTQFFGTTGRRILFNDLLIGDKIRLISLVIPGDFNFYYTPPDLVLDYDSRFYRNVYRKGAFQEFVKKQMDSKGRFPLQVTSSPTTVCDRWVQDALQPMYEDFRRDCKLRDETAATYTIDLAPRMWSPRFNIEDGIDTTNERPLIGDLYSFTMPYAPLMDGSGNPAVPTDITVLKDSTALYILKDGTACNFVESVGANFTNDLIDGTVIAQAGDATLTGIYFNSPYSNLTAWNLRTGDQINLAWSDSSNFYISSDSSNFFISKILSSTSVLLDSTVTYGGTFTASKFNYHTESPYVSLVDSNIYWDSTGLDGTTIKSPIIGDELQFNYYYQAVDGTNLPASTTFIFGINYWQLPGAPISNGQGTDFLALPSDVQLSVDGTSIPDAVTDIEAVLGFITVQDQKDFWLASPLGRAPIPSYSLDGTHYSGDTFVFSYYKSGSTTYTSIFDDPSRVMDDDVVFDGAGTDPYRTPTPAESPLQIGYKFRADLLHHASVLNSTDTLLLNNYQKPATRASIANRQDTLNHFNYFFSPEFLTDTSRNIVLNDAYLDKDTSAALVLNAGIPTFQQTYAYQPGMIHQNKLQNVRSNRNLLMYCDLLLKETQTGNSEVHLSSICDNESPRFSVRFRENIDQLSECEEWILFDTGDTTQVQISIPGSYEPVQNLRVQDIELRNNFILRDMSSTGLALTNYIYHEYDNVQNSFQLPATTRVTMDGTGYDFPALPVMHDSTTLATASDVIVSIDDVPTPGLISSFDPTTGAISLYPQSDLTIIQYVQVTQEEIDQMYIKLDKFPIDPEYVVVNVLHGPAQAYGLDFVVNSDLLYFEHPLRNVLSPGDVLVVTYDAASLRNREIKFTYKINSTGIVTVIDLSRSRVFDNDDVYPYFCYDGYQQTVGFNFKEYANFLSDYSKGIKFKYFNKDTLQLEEHIFSGPVFETYSVFEDEISAMESFPNALVKIANPLAQTDPISILSNYDFLNDEAVRIRKKTIQELLPDRTFRTMKIYEAMPV